MTGVIIVRPRAIVVFFSVFWGLFINEEISIRAGSEYSRWNFARVGLAGWGLLKMLTRV